MATFTMELKRVIETIFNESIDPYDFEQTYQSASYNNVTYGKLPTVPNWTALGLGTYPIFDEEYRSILNGKIVDEYFMREIGTETIDMFIWTIRRKMDQIMPYYNKLYESENISYDALMTMDIHSVGASTSTDSNTNTATNNSGSTNTSNSRAVSQELPQTMLAGNEDYATAASDSNSSSVVNADSTQNGSSESNGSNNSDSRVTGFQGVASDLIMRYRNSLLNIDAMILSNIEDCFMLVLNNGDSYSKGNYFYVY